MHIRFPLYISQGYSNVIDELCMRVSFDYILLEIKLEQGLVTVINSKQKNWEEYATMTKMLKK